MRSIREIIIVLFGLSLSYSTFGQTKIDSELDSLIVEGVFVERFYQHQDDDSIVSPDEKLVVIDSQFDICFINKKKINKKGLKDILKNIGSYELSRDEMYLVWDYDAEAFFLALSMPNKEAKVRRVKWPSNDCAQYTPRCRANPSRGMVS